MSIKHQKILIYIPIANFLIIFFWIGAYYRNKTTPMRFLENLLKMFLALFVINIPRAIIGIIEIPGIVNNVLFFICTYLSLFCMAFIAIRDQEKFFNSD